MSTQKSQAKDISFFGLSLGYYNVLEGHSEAVDFRAHYRFAHSVVFKKMRPWAELNLTSKGNIWLGSGLSYDIRLSDSVVLTPSFGLGLYKHTKGDFDLSYPIEFKSQIEIGYQFKNKTRISLGFSHFSNAGLGRHNPGAETLSLYYYIPFNKIL